MSHDAVASAGASVEVATVDGSYSVHVGRGILATLPDLLERHAPAHRFAVISDDQVGPLHGARVCDVCRAGGLDVILLTFPAGEASKTRESWARLTDEMLDAGLQAIMVSAPESSLAASFVGQLWSAATLQQLPESVDPCGERGEFHTCLVGGVGLEPLALEVGEIVHRDGSVYADIVLAQ